MFVCLGIKCPLKALLQLPLTCIWLYSSNKNSKKATPKTHPCEKSMPYSSLYHCILLFLVILLFLLGSNTFCKNPLTAAMGFVPDMYGPLLVP